MHRLRTLQSFVGGHAPCFLIPRARIARLLQRQNIAALTLPRAATTSATEARMVVNLLESQVNDDDVRTQFADARQRMLHAGYSVDVPEVTSEAQRIHCNHQRGTEGFSWLRNGFIQCFTEKDGRQARVAAYAPGQQLQPHIHDIDELFLIGGGRILVSRWPLTAAGEPGAREAQWLGPGDLLEIPAGTPHALYACPREGCVFHELIGEGDEAFAVRSTEFLVDQGFELATKASG